MLFTADHDEVRRSLQKFIASEINPFVDQWEAADIFPAHELFKKLGNLGFLGLNKPEAFGGQGLDYSYALMMAEELGAIRCGGVPMAIGVQTDMATPALARFGSDEVRREFLAPSIAGDVVACIGVSEPGAGSDFRRRGFYARHQGRAHLSRGQGQRDRRRHRGDHEGPRQPADGVVMHCFPSCPAIVACLAQTT
jgi:citronellyl-CoA dehydrogenase